MNRRKNLAASGLAALLFVSIALLSAPMAHSFVPSCEEELAQAYPSLLQPDLAACDERDTEIDADPEARATKFAAQLRGSWQLASRTIEGLPIDPESRSTRLYFDVAPRGPNGYVGRAMLIDRDLDATGVAPADSVAGLWRIVIDQAQSDRISLKLERGTSSGVAPASQQPAQEHDFYQTSGAFVSVFDESTTSNRWERMVLMDNTLTYVSCDDGTVERFVKTSDREPRIEEGALQEYWQKLQDDPNATVPAARD